MSALIVVVIGLLLIVSGIAALFIYLENEPGSDVTTTPVNGTTTETPTNGTTQNGTTTETPTNGTTQNGTTTNTNPRQVITKCLAQNGYPETKVGGTSSYTITDCPAGQSGTMTGRTAVFKGFRIS